MEPEKPSEESPNSLPRRSFLRIAGLTGAGWVVGATGLTLLEAPVGRIFEPLNQRVEELLLNPQKPVPELPASAIEPEALLVNSFRFNPRIDVNKFQLVVDGEVEKPLSLSMEQIYQLPFQSMVIRHVCVEGWAAVVQWGGIPLRELVRLAKPKPGVRYAYFLSADGYYSSWDLRSTVHPQTLLAYQMNGKSLPVENGAPLRLASPIKLGYKMSKWVTQVSLVSNLLDEKGYWEDRGYEWFAGL